MKEGTVAPSRTFRIRYKSNRKIEEIQNRLSNAPKFYLNLIHDRKKLIGIKKSLKFSSRKQKFFFLSVLSI